MKKKNYLINPFSILILISIFLLVLFVFYQNLVSIVMYPIFAFYIVLLEIVGIPFLINRFRSNRHHLKLLLISYLVSILAFMEIFSRVALLQGFNPFSKMIILINSVLLMVLNAHIYIYFKNTKRTFLRFILLTEVVLLGLVGISTLCCFNTFPVLIILLHYPILVKHHLLHKNVER